MFPEYNARWNIGVGESSVIFAQGAANFLTTIENVLKCTSKFILGRYASRELFTKYQRGEFWHAQQYYECKCIQKAD